MKQQGLSFEPFEVLVNSGDTQQLQPPITLIPGYLNQEQQAALLNEVKSYPLSRPEVQVYGQAHPIPRTQVWFGDSGCDYRYSGLFVSALPWPKYANKLREKLYRDFKLETNGVLVNRYADGRDSMGWHCDDEVEIRSGSDIASVSIGARRDFFIRHKISLQKYQIPLNSGDLLIMHWPMQNEWEHSVPKRLKVMEPRVNFTFRLLTKHYHSK